jgi:hypothetical protein
MWFLRKPKELSRFETDRIWWENQARSYEYKGMNLIISARRIGGYITEKMIDEVDFSLPPYRAEAINYLVRRGLIKKNSQGGQGYELEDKGWTFEGFKAERRKILKEKYFLEYALLLFVAASIISIATTQLFSKNQPQVQPQELEQLKVELSQVKAQVDSLKALYHYQNP